MKKKTHEKKLPNTKDKLLKGNEGRRHKEIQEELKAAKVVDGVVYLKAYNY